jgi:hypothetical protein
MFMWLKIYVQYSYRYYSTWYNTYRLHFYSSYNENGHIQQIPLTLVQKDRNIWYFTLWLQHFYSALASESSRTRFAHSRLFPVVLVLFSVIKTVLHHKADRQLQLFKKQTEIKLPSGIQSRENKNQSTNSSRFSKNTLRNLLLCLFTYRIHWNGNVGPKRQEALVTRVTCYSYIEDTFP